MDVTSRPMARDDWNRRYFARELLWTADPSRVLVAEAADLAPGCALDLAAGEGRNAAWLAEQGWTVRAVDHSGLALAKGELLAVSKDVQSRVDFVDADLRGYRPETLHFDLVMLAYLQVPQDELALILRRAADAVAPGGTLLLVAHHPHNFAHGIGGPRDPAVLYSAEQAVALLGDGLEVEKAERVERPVRSHAGSGVAIDTVVRAYRPI